MKQDPLWWTDVRPFAVRWRPPAGYISPSVRGVCSECGAVVQVSRTSAPPERRRCRDCQRARPKMPYQKQPTGIVRCPCGQVFEQRVATQRYCCAEHRPKAGNLPAGSTTARGYGYEHQQARRAAMAVLLPGTPCARCGEGMWPDQKLELDHNDDRTGYLGLSHGRCNRRAGTIKGNRMRGGNAGELSRAS